MNYSIKIELSDGSIVKCSKKEALKFLDMTEEDVDTTEIIFCSDDGFFDMKWPLVQQDRLSKKIEKQLQ